MTTAPAPEPAARRVDDVRRPRRDLDTGIDRLTEREREVMRRFSRHELTRWATDRRLP